ncbi:MAG TPA: DNA polymerase III subunit delta [bacterium]|nr:DNA polymerase III subunit delta [bacterium]
MIIFFYGENDFKINQKVQELQNKFIKEVDSSGNNIFKFEGEKIKLEEISGQIGSGSLFCNKKMIIISDLIKNKQKNILNNISEYISKNKVEDSNDIFIFTEKNIKNKGAKGLLKITGERESPLNKEEKDFYNILTKQKFSQEFKTFNQTELTDFIKKEFNNYGLKIDNKETQLLLALSGDNTWNIYTEIKKIAHFKLSQQPDNKINSQDIEKMGSGIFTENIFNFTDAISAKNIKSALKILEEQYSAGSEPDYIVSMLLRQFKILLQIRELLDLNFNSQRILANLKLHPFVINKGINQAKNFEIKKIKKIINELARIEKINRQGQTNIKANINLLISSL